MPGQDKNSPGAHPDEEWCISPFYVQCLWNAQAHPPFVRAGIIGSKAGIAGGAGRTSCECLVIDRGRIYLKPCVRLPERLMAGSTANLVGAYVAEPHSPGP
jgi:hypothetical protein